MSRVEADAQRAADEAERAQKNSDKQAREAKNQESRDAFGRLVKSGQQASQTAKRADGEKQQAKAQEEQGNKATQAKAGESDRAARMARGGTLAHSRILEQAKGFQGALEGQRAKSAEENAERVGRRDEGAEVDRVRGDDREQEVEKAEESRKDGEAELKRAEAKDDARSAPVDPDGRRQNQQQQHSGGDGGGGGRPPASVTPTAKAKAAAPPKQIPPELLEKLVSTVYLAVNDKGLKEFHIEMKDGPLKGGTLRISADDGGGVSLVFTGLEGNQKNLIESSKGELMRRLEKKGLRLTRLEAR